MPQPPLTFVTVVEAGNLEVDAVRLFASLRTFGGHLKDSEALAIRPRAGVAVSGATRRALKALRVTLIEQPQPHRQIWFRFLPKPLALAMADKVATGEGICWLDADTLLTRPPDGLVLGNDTDFLGCCSDKEQGSSGPGDPFDPLWLEMARAVDISPEALPWFTAIRENVKIRCYWNSGVFTYRRSSGLGGEFLRLTERLLDARMRLNHPGYGIGICEMASLGFAMHRLGLRHRELAEAWNYSVFPKAENKWYQPQRLGTAAVVHYHDSLWPHHRQRLLDSLDKAQPLFSAWLKTQPPTANNRRFLAKLLIKMYRKRRDGLTREFLAGCRVIEPSTTA